MQNTKPIEFEVFQFRNETKTLKNVQVVIERISETFIEELFLNSRNKMCFYFWIQAKHEADRFRFRTDPIKKMKRKRLRMSKF